MYQNKKKHEDSGTQQVTGHSEAQGAKAVTKNATQAQRQRKLAWI